MLVASGDEEEQKGPIHMALPPPDGMSPWKQFSHTILPYKSMFPGKQAWNSLFPEALWSVSANEAILEDLAWSRHRMLN